jgi:hypothetical protein
MRLPLLEDGSWFYQTINMPLHQMIEETGFFTDQTMQQATSLVISKIEKLQIVIFIIRVKMVE